MQTFLPLPSFEESLACLDTKRLGKQRVEAAQLISVIKEPIRDGKLRAWANHPAANMWRYNLNALRLYYNWSIIIWESRGYENNLPFEEVPSNYTLPWWLGNKEFHDSHKSNLLRKDYQHYSQFGWDVASDSPYIWPE